MFLLIAALCFALVLVDANTPEPTPTATPISPPKMDYDYIRESLMDKKFKAIWDEELLWGVTNLADQMKAKGPEYFIKDPSYYYGDSGEKRWASLRRYIIAIGPKGFYEGFMANIGLV